ncbi:MAG: DUF4406 domain-containing protein [Bacteroidetes bacterium]|nr:DUF4406 domain-containing protein [Bacteroidota bacterium]
MKKKVFISGPMTDMKNYNQQSFQVAQYWLESQGYEVRSPAVFPHNWSKFEDYMTLDLAMLEMCDFIFLLPGWTRSAGALMESNRAIDLEVQELKYDKGILDVLQDIYESLRTDN